LLCRRPKVGRECLEYNFFKPPFDEIKMVLGYPLPRLFVVETVDKQWTAEERRERTPAGYPRKISGLYFYWDVFFE